MKERFKTEREAKEFLAEHIADEARRQGEPLSEVEGKMLYFTESGWTLPDIADVVYEFEQRYDKTEYEKKIKALAHAARTRLDKADRAEWTRAAKRLDEGDHYLSLMLYSSRSGATPGASSWPIAAFVLATIAGFAVVLPLVLDRYLGHFPTQDERGFYTWAIALAGGVVYGVVYAVRHRN